MVQVLLASLARVSDPLLETSGGRRLTRVGCELQGVRSGVPIRKPIHHLRESAPMNALGRLTPRTRPEQRPASDLQLAQFQLLAIDLQRKRRLRLRECRVRNFRLYFICPRQRPRTALRPFV